MTKQIYQLYVALQDSKPLIWRRILVYPDIKLADFHRIIQTVMGWTNSHLHQFEKDQQVYSPEEFQVEDAKNSRTIKLNKLLKKEKDRIEYLYDFGDYWLHDIILDKILMLDIIWQVPCCVDGMGNCPPDDCGGIMGYDQLKDIIANPKHEEYNETIEWLGGEFDPNYFDRIGINERLTYPGYGCEWIE